MPGKVNPVIPESVVMAAAQVIGNDTAITVGCQAGNFQLNVMLPLLARNLLQVRVPPGWAPDHAPAGPRVLYP